MIAELRVDHFFLGVDGIDPEVGPMTPDILEAELNAIMIRSAREVTVVTDSSKIGRSSLSLIGPINSVHRIITDSGITPRHAELLKVRGIQVVIVPGRPSN